MNNVNSAGMPFSRFPGLSEDELRSKLREWHRDRIKRLTVAGVDFFGKYRKSRTSLNLSFINLKLLNLYFINLRMTFPYLLQLLRRSRL